MLLLTDITDAYGRIIEKEVILGGIKTKRDGTIVKAEAFQMIMNLKNNMVRLSCNTSLH